MSDGRRVQRVEKELREIIALFVVRNFSGDLLNVTQVRATKDLRGAKVYVSALGQENVNPDTLERLQEQAPAIQHEISKRLHMRYCPRLQFANDEGVSASQKVETLLAQIRN